MSQELSTDAARALIAAHRHLLTTPNVVSLDYGEKTVGGNRTGRRALVVGVIRKAAPGQIAAPDVLVPPSVTVDGGRGPVEIPTDVVEEGEIRAINGLPVPGGTYVKTDGLNLAGSLGVNINYNGHYRLLSCAHVLTAFDQAYVGRTVKYYDHVSDKEPAGNLAAVSGMAPVTYYDRVDPPDPVYNTQDLAWADITDRIGKPEIREVGVPTGIRAPVQGEKVEVCGGFSQWLQKGDVASLVVTHRVKSKSSTGQDVYTFWQNSIKLEGDLVLMAGDSGSAVVATNDKKVVCLAFSISLLYTYGCPL